MKNLGYITQGTCSHMINIDLNDDNTIANVAFIGGCHGNTQGVAALVKGMHAKDAIARLKGINCHMKGTSCPDQLARALEQMIAE